MTYDCIIVGGGIAGTQAAIQLGRYCRQVAVIDGGYGRSTLCRAYHNVLGWPAGVSGETLRQLGRQQAEGYGVTWLEDWVETIVNQEHLFEVHTRTGQLVLGQRLLLATGVLDNLPDITGLAACLGITVYVCPDCDGYEVRGKKTVVLGQGKAGAQMALALTYWQPKLIYIDHDSTPLPDDLSASLRQLGVERRQAHVQQIRESRGQLRAVELTDGTILEVERAFVAFGHNTVHSELAAQLGVSLHHNRHILVDARTKATSVPFIWAAGDVVAHSEQVSIAMGEGAQAAIWIHKSLLPRSTFPEKWPNPST
ncbi:thioredoxin-disulfide reductase [Alicyclobacillus hesperidum subsp. aegles]|uniref:NAD(P)/FAD-dependent oxidoreductase n=1 Tax=Alicyclobacillus hesperidum TaxID=89784 RepID=UPI000719349A|nr:NAD(P)/FAD-dependent oxidoreductase [Alicyclobacillus hesperidum]KRW90807.1 pyridine nucleotide-disulfide oxidoreductase [Alicyclobacillus tengchongensis]GLG01672.1 thioredoxin-disulfide reductase [Alicyclobacillus hesperidum subsp. aegles]